MGPPRRSAVLSTSKERLGASSLMVVVLVVQFRRDWEKERRIDDGKEIYTSRLECECVSPSGPADIEYETWS